MYFRNFRLRIGNDFPQKINHRITVRLGKRSRLFQ